MPTLVFLDGRIMTVREDTWKLLDSGGEADIYLANIKGREYIVKVFTEKQTKIAKPLERIREITARLYNYADRCTQTGILPKSLTMRGFPVAVGIWNDRAVMVFRSVKNFTTIAEIVNRKENIIKYWKENDKRTRVAFALDVMRALACLETADIIHVDVTTANAAYGYVDDVKGVFLFDIETAAIVGSEDYALAVIPARDSHYIPVDSLEKIGIKLRAPKPEELPLVIKPTRTPREVLSWIMWTPIWYGLQLIGFIYLGMSIFQGLPAISIMKWYEIVEHEKERNFIEAWPPKAFLELGYLSQREYYTLYRDWSLLGRHIIKALYRTFVIDLAEKRPLPTYTLSALV